MNAISTNPFLLGGTDRFDSVLAEDSLGRVIAKVGAEGMHCAFILDSGIGIALKVEDGNPRAQHPAMVQILQDLDALPEPLPARLAEYLRRPVKNSRGEVVGETRIRDRAGRQSGPPVEVAAI